MDCWITTHWPSPEGFEVSRHVYFKSGRAVLPKVGDLVLIYEAESATVGGKAVKHAEMRFRGKRERVELPKGRGRIVAAVTVEGHQRAIGDGDLVYEYGNLIEWSILPCGRLREVNEVSRGEVMELLGKPAGTPPRFWSLWKVPEEFVGKLRGRLGI
jgi:hypothetical protein